MAQDLNALRSVKPAVVVHPASHHRIDEFRKILQTLVVPGGCHSPFTNGRADRHGGLGADRWKKAHEELPPTILRPSRLKGIAQEVERYALVFPVPVVILAVDDPGLRWMKLQTALLEPTPDGFQHELGLSLTPAMASSA